MQPRTALTSKTRRLGPGIGARALLLFAVLAVLAFGSLTHAQTPSPAVAYVLVVHPSNPETSVDRQFVAQGFLKKITSWSHGGVIRPVDLAPGSAVRRNFSLDALGRPIAAVKSYWQQMIFSGRAVPPPELPSEDDVLRYVLREPGAIGYVSAGTDLRGAKVLATH